MENHAHQKDSPAKGVLFGSIAAYAVYQMGWPDGHPLWFQISFWIAVLVLAKGAINLLAMLLAGVMYGWQYGRAHRGEGIKGDASFLTAAQAKSEGLGDPNNGAFLGLIDDQPVFAKSESASLVLGPNGSGKTSLEAVGRIAYCPNSLIAFDVKGELYELTHDLRRRWHGDDVVLVNPIMPGSESINPLDLICDALAENNGTALVYASDFAKQLHPMPKGGGGANTFFIEGAQQLLEDIFLLVCSVYGKGKANLAFCYEHLINMDLLRKTVVLAAESEALNGEVALRAESVSRGLTADEGDD